MKRFVLAAMMAMGSAAFAQTLVYGSGGEPVNLESGNITDGNSIIVQRQIYDTLVDFADGTTNAIPGLAIKWASNADATEWVFYLRQGVKFHDGSAFNADAVVFNVTRWWDPKAEYGFRDSGKEYVIWADLMGGYKGEAGSYLKSVTKVNNYAVKFTMNKPVTTFPDLIGSGYFGIASPKAIKDQGAKYGTPTSTPVGTGPFTFVSWKKGDRVNLKTNASYWADKAKVDEVVFRFIADRNARLNELRAGTIDFTSDLDPQAYKGMKSESKIEPLLKPSFNVGYLALNVGNKYLKDVKVRQAISMAFDKKAIVEAFWGELGISNASFVPPVLAWANSKKVPADYKYDPAGAKKLLAEAGYPNGFSADFWYMPVSRPYFPAPKDIAEALASELSSVGIKVNLKTKDWAQYLADRRKAPGFDIFMLGWTGDYGDPDNFYAPHFDSSATDDLNWKSSEVDALIAKGKAAKSQKAKADAYSKLHELTYNAYVRIPIVHSRPLAGKAKYVKGWVPSPLGSEAFNKITVEGK